MGKLSVILSLCKTLDKTAAKMYTLFAQAADRPAHKAFWQDVAQDEEKHVGYFDSLLLADRGNELDYLVDRPEKIAAELQVRLNAVETEMQTTRLHGDTAAAMRAALRLEALILNANFSKLLQALHDTGAHLSAEEDYREHLKKFHRFATGELKDTPEFELVTGILLDLWQQSRELARKTSEIKSLRGLIPICSHCKQIRGDAEQWQQLETYIREHSEAQFSHGICPQCARKYYPEVKIYDE